LPNISFLIAATTTPLKVPVFVRLVSLYSDPCLLKIGYDIYNLGILSFDWLCRNHHNNYKIC
jgi:hypothetical protein